MSEAIEVKADTVPSDAELLRIIGQALVGFKGDATVLEGAIGALVWGRHVGWQGLRLMHAFYTLRRYEAVLGVKFRDVLPERTERSRMMRGVRMADKFGKFWQAVSSGTILPGDAKMVGETKGKVNHVAK